MNQDDANDFVKKWHAGVNEFTIFSSGSTGKPKSTVLKKEWMQWSAAQTALYLNPQKGDKILIALPLDKVGGLMMLVRALEWQIEYELFEPVLNPLLISNTSCNITSLTPMQLHSVLSDEKSKSALCQLKSVLIGGSELNLSLEKQLIALESQCVFWQTYGMTETYSHVALRKINGENRQLNFHRLQGIEIEKMNNGCALIKTPYYPEGIQTNDVIEIDADGGFRVLGRSDFIINSGGVKIQVELVESWIQETLQPKNNFAISSKKDEILGERMVLVTENKSEYAEVNWKQLQAYEKYWTPSEVIEIKKLPMNSGAKLDRLAIKNIIDL